MFGGATGFGGVNLGAAWDKYVNGNQAADVVPSMNYGGKFNTGGSTPAPAVRPAGRTETGQIQGFMAPSGPYVGGDGGASAAAAADAAEVANTRLQIQQGIDQNNSALGRVDNQLNTAMGNIQGDYNSAYDRLTGQRSASNRNYETGQTNQQNDYLNSRANISSNTRNLYNSGQRLLASQGAGGGSAARFAVGDAAQREGANMNADVQNTNARNLSSLATANEDNERQFKSGFGDLSSQLESSQRGTRSQFETQRAEILNSIAQLSGQKAILNGGNYESALAASRPYTDRVSGILNNVDAMAANPTRIREQNVSLARPDLAEYRFDRFTAPQQVAASPQDSTMMNPSIAALLGLDDQRREQLA